MIRDGVPLAVMSVTKGVASFLGTYVKLTVVLG